MGDRSGECKSAVGVVILWILRTGGIAVNCRKLQFFAVGLNLNSPLQQQNPNSKYMGILDIGLLVFFGRVLANARWVWCDAFGCDGFGDTCPFC
jgi:hypothetical protein